MVRFEVAWIREILKNILTSDSALSFAPTLTPYWFVLLDDLLLQEQSEYSPPVPDLSTFANDFQIVSSQNQLAWRVDALGRILLRAGFESSETSAPGTLPFTDIRSCSDLMLDTVNSHSRLIELPTPFYWVIIDYDASHRPTPGIGSLTDDLEQLNRVTGELDFTHLTAVAGLLRAASFRLSGATILQG